MDDLNFRFTVTLVAVDQTFELSGVCQSEWDCEHFPNAAQAAWAFVRGQLDVVGAWLCSVELSGEDRPPEWRTIDVSQYPDGSMARMDRTSA